MGEWSGGEGDTYDDLLLNTHFIVKRLRPLFVGGAIQIHFD